MLLSFKVRVSANERESSKLSLKKTARYWPQQKIYLMSLGSASTDSSNSFPTLLWEPPRQKYLERRSRNQAAAYPESPWSSTHSQSFAGRSVNSRSRTHHSSI